MRYIKVAVEIGNTPEFLAEIVIAHLSSIGYESFEEASDSLYAYIPESFYDLRALDNVLCGYLLPYKVERIEPKNWNAIWESTYAPVSINKELLVKSDFHKTKAAYNFTITINPEMAFGTGHHKTTVLMLKAILSASSFKNKKLLDLGCGTGVLSILAAKMNASKIVAMDIDEIACETCKKNLIKNGIKTFHVQQGRIGDLDKRTKYDYIFANINTNVLVGESADIVQRLAKNGKLFLSGFLEKDMKVLVKNFEDAGLKLERELTDKAWKACIFS